MGHTTSTVRYQGKKIYNMIIIINSGRFGHCVRAILSQSIQNRVKCILIKFPDLEKYKIISKSNIFLLCLRSSYLVVNF